MANDMTVKWYNSRLGTVKAVYGHEERYKGIWLKASFRSNIIGGFQLTQTSIDYVKSVSIFTRYVI